ncbi:hypothetical protein [Oricola nitratireducens]|uniref:hypothetical protein n=1 Tax=Oricola nitratireducens TaxID=2775868 RepID=UPI001868F86F|nr:hypothetical protein [Oricola nitratireducens]
MGTFIVNLAPCYFRFRGIEIVEHDGIVSFVVEFMAGEYAAYCFGIEEGPVRVFNSSDEQEYPSTISVHFTPGGKAEETRVVAVEYDYDHVEKWEASQRWFDTDHDGWLRDFFERWAARHRSAPRAAA